MSRRDQTWKEYAGRSSGPDGYKIGDLCLHVVNKLMGNLPAEGGVQAINDDDCALLDLKAQRDQLVGHRKRVTKLVAKDEENARSFVQAGRKEFAMLALRKKRMHEQMVVDCETHVTRVDEMIDHIESAQVQAQVVAALKTGVDTLKKIQREIGGVDYVQKLMDEHADLAEMQQEINQELAGAGVASDDAEFAAELARLEAEHAASVLAQSGGPASSGTAATAAEAVSGGAPVADASTTMSSEPPIAAPTSSQPSSAAYLSQC